MYQARGYRLYLLESLLQPDYACSFCFIVENVARNPRIRNNIFAYEYVAQTLIPKKNSNLQTES